MTARERAIEAANSPAVTLIYRGAMGLAMAVIIWFGSEFLKHKDDHSVSDRNLAVALERLSVTLENQQRQMGDRYTASDAARDMKAVNDRITTLAGNISRQVDRLSDRVREIELQ